MATSSFDKKFIVTDPDAIKAILEGLEQPSEFKSKPSLNLASKETLERLKRRAITMMTNEGGADC